MKSDAFSDLKTWGSPQAMNSMGKKVSKNGERSMASSVEIKSATTPRSPFRSDPPPAKQRPISQRAPGATSFDPGLDLDSLIAQPRAAPTQAAVSSHHDPFGNFADLSISAPEASRPPSVAPPLSVPEPQFSQHGELGSLPHTPEAPDNPFAEVAKSSASSHQTSHSARQGSSSANSSNGMATPPPPRPAPPSYDDIFGTSSAAPSPRPAPAPTFSPHSASPSVSASTSHSDFFAAHPGAPTPLPPTGSGRAAAAHARSPEQNDLLSGFSGFSSPPATASGAAFAASGSTGSSRHAAPADLLSMGMPGGGSAPRGVPSRSTASGSVAASLLDDEPSVDFLGGGQSVPSASPLTAPAQPSAMHSRSAGDFQGMGSPALSANGGAGADFLSMDGPAPSASVDDMFGGHDIFGGGAGDAAQQSGPMGDDVGLSDDGFFSFGASAAPAQQAPSEAPGHAAARKPAAAAGFGGILDDDEASALRGKLAHLTTTSSLYEVAAAVGVQHDAVGQSAMTMWMKRLSTQPGADAPPVRVQAWTRRVHLEMASVLLARQEQQQLEQNVQQEADARHAVQKDIRVEVHKWAMDKYGSPRSLANLLSELHKVLWEGAKWTAVPLWDVLDNTGKRTKTYHKACLLTHPDKHGDSPPEVKERAHMIFDYLKTAKDKK